MSFDYIIEGMTDDEFEYSDTITDANFEHDYRALVSKVGGGGLGYSYAGHWFVRIYNDHGEMIVNTGELYTGTHKKHDDIAIIALDFYINSTERV